MDTGEPDVRAIDRFYELADANPRQCVHGIMLADQIMYQVTIESVSRSGKTVYFRCNGSSGMARRDNVGEWLTVAEPRWPIRFTPPVGPAPARE